MNKKLPKATVDQITADRFKKQNPYAHLDDEGDYTALAPISTAENNSNLINLSDLRDSNSLGKHRSRKDIKGVVRSLQAKIWRNRNLLFDSTESTDPIQMLDPIITLRAIGYDVITGSGLGQYDNGNGQTEVAGYIDSSKNVVAISSQFRSEVRNFTAAHELGHAVLHEAIGMHRDRPLDGGAVSITQEPLEIEANKFASIFLMPERLVKREFQARFQSEQFTVDDDSAFLLANSTMDKLKMKTPDQLARMLAESERYGSTFISMKSRFNVSTEAMAIRLKELKLVNYRTNKK